MCQTGCTFDFPGKIVLTHPEENQSRSTALTPTPFYDELSFLKYTLSEYINFEVPGFICRSQRPLPYLLYLCVYLNPLVSEMGESSSFFPHKKSISIKDTSDCSKSLPYNGQK